MPEARTIDKPARWDLPFSRDLANEAERRAMSDADIERLLSIEPFLNMDPDRFPKTQPLRGILTNDTRIRHYRNGDVIVRQGDYGHSAFLILSGQARVLLDTLDPALVGKSQLSLRSRLRSLLGLATNPKMPEIRDTSAYPKSRKRPDDRSSSTSSQRVFVQDITNIVATGGQSALEQSRFAQMSAGELFGELSALGRIARTATVVADGDAELLEIRWQGLRDLRKYDDTLRHNIDQMFRTRGLAATLTSSPLLQHLSDQDAQKVAQAANFETYGSFDWYGSYKQLRQRHEDPLSKEPIIAAQGDYPNGLLMIRSGFARVSRKHGHGEHTYSYLSKGDVFGLSELVHNVRNKQQLPLTSTLRAIGYVDVVQLPTRVVEALILPQIQEDMIPELPAAVLAEAFGEPITAATPSTDTDDHSSGVTPMHSDERVNPALTEFLVENRFINGTATMMIDLNRCTRCDDCVRACAGGHSNNPRFIRHGEVFGNLMIANACMHCADPVCMIGCPTGAIQRDTGGGQVIINDNTCIGCGTCAGSCPYSNIRMVDIRDKTNPDAVMIDPAAGKPIAKATKCDLCVEHHGGPACERACPHDALRRVDMRNLEPHIPWLSR